jgi:Na+/proline symporter
MYRHVDNIFRVSFCTFFFALIAGIYFLVAGKDGYNQALIVGTLASVIVVTLALYEVLSSKQIRSTYKILWAIFFISFNTLAGLVYFLVGREKIRGDY